jgi:hypothetical protein
MTEPDRPPTIGFWQAARLRNNPYLQGWLFLGQLSEMLAALAGAALVWGLAGGSRAQMNRMWDTGNILGDDGRPFLAAVVAFLIACYTSLMAETLTRRAHNRRARQWHEAFTARVGSPGPVGAGDGPRDILERLVLQCGPLTWDDMHALLNLGGTWGPPVKASKHTLGKLLKDRTTGASVAWLVARGEGGLYVHRRAEPATNPQEKAKSDADHSGWGARNR